MKLLIKNAHVIDPDSRTDAKKDILIENGLIKAIENLGQAGTADRVLDAKGHWVVPGLIDLHVHLREPGYEWKEDIASGVKAAIHGGYTSICCMPNTNPVNDKAEISRYILEKAQAAGLTKVLPIGSVSQGLKGEIMSPLTELYKAGCVAFSDDGEPVYDSQLMRRALEWCLMIDKTICCHEEDKKLSQKGCMNESALSAKMGLRGFPGIAEEVMIARDIELARYTGGKVHICHVSTARALELVRRGKNDGIKVTCEVTPHHLMLNEDDVGIYDTNFKMSPPLRAEKDRLALIEGLKDGTVDAIASDHAPHELDSKRVEFEEAAMGILGLQTSLPLMLDFFREGVISKFRLFELLSAGPARVFNLAQGKIKAGAPADITVIDPEYKWTFDKDKILSKSYNSPFIGRGMQGLAVAVIVDGKILHRAEEFNEN